MFTYPAGIRIIRLVVMFFYDKFPIFNKAVHSSGGGYFTFGNLSRAERAQLRNIFPWLITPPNIDRSLLCLIHLILFSQTLAFLHFRIFRQIRGIGARSGAVQRDTVRKGVGRWEVFCLRGLWPLNGNYDLIAMFR